MKTPEEQIKQYDEEIERLQKAMTYSVNTENELRNFILETKAHQFAITNLLCSLLAKTNQTNLHLERQRYEVFSRAKLLELLKGWAAKYGNTAQKASGPS